MNAENVAVGGTGVASSRLTVSVTVGAACARADRSDVAARRTPATASRIIVMNRYLSFGSYEVTPSSLPIARVGFNIIYAPFTAVHRLVHALYLTITAVTNASDARLPAYKAVQPATHRCSTAFSASR